MTEEELKWLDHAASRLERSTDGYDRVTARHLRALESRVLAERKQEPVGYLVRYADTHGDESCGFRLDFRMLKNLPDGAPLFAHPTPDDAKDAARYRWLKMESPPYPQRQLMLSTPWGQWDAAIDRARQSGEEN